MRGICILSILLGAGVAVGQPLPRAEDKAEADRLFEEGRTLLASGQRAEACQKFDLSIRKDPRAVGTMLNLGLCREEVGQIATAVRYYEEARDRAHDQKLGEHQQAAERKLALLAPRVPHLKIALPPDVPARTKLVVDDMVVALDSAGDIPVDPGTHTITVTAPGKLPFEGKATLAEAQHETVTVPPLEGAKTVVIRERSSRRALWGKIMVAGGVAALGGGVGLAYLAKGQYWDQFPEGSRDGVAVMDTVHDCWTSNDGTRIVRECNARGHEATTSAKRLSTIGIITAIAGGAIATTGAVLWITAPSPTETPMLSVDVHPDGASFAFMRAF